MTTSSRPCVHVCVYIIQLQIKYTQWGLKAYFDILRAFDIQPLTLTIEQAVSAYQSSFLSSALCVVKFWASLALQATWLKVPCGVFVHWWCCKSMFWWVGPCCICISCMHAQVNMNSCWKLHAFHCWQLVEPRNVAQQQPSQERGRLPASKHGCKQWWF